MKNSTKVIIFGGLIALVGGAYYFTFRKDGKTSVKNEKKPTIELGKLSLTKFKSRK